MSTKATAPEPGERRSTEWAHSVLRERIVSGAMTPGTVVPQAVLADELGISRTPLREAMRLLQSEGLLEGEPNRRLRVARVTIEELEQLYAMRITNESLALRLSVARMVEGDSAVIRSALESMEAAALAADAQCVESSHRLFHRLLVERAGARFVQLADTLWDHTARYRAAYLESAGSLVSIAFDAQDDHARILSAVEAGDGDAAASALAHHYARTAEALISAAGRGDEPLVVRAAVEQAERTR